MEGTMAKPNEKYLKWLSTHPAEEAWKRIVEDTNLTIGTAVDPENTNARANEKSLAALHCLTNLSESVCRV
jgi:hypothetical protein